MRVLMLSLVALVAMAQNPNTAKYPTAVPTDTDLQVAKNLLGASLTLTAGIDASTLTINVNDGSLVPTPGVVRIEFELIQICSKAGNVLTVCASGRGFDGSVAATHNSGTALSNVVVAAHHNQLAAEVKAIATALGTNFVGSYVVRTPGGECANGMTILKAGGIWICAEYGSCPTCVVTTGTYNAPSWLTGLQPTSAKNGALGYAGLTGATKLNKAQGDEVWGIADLWDAAGKRGNGNDVQMTTGAVAANDCAKFDAAGNIVSAGAACGAGSGSDNPDVSFTAQTSVTFTHNLNSTKVLINCYDASNNAIQPNGITLSNVNAAAITFAAAQTGRCVANASGGGTGTGGGAEQLNDLTDVTAKQGNGTIVPMWEGTPATDDCVKVNANGNLTTAGAACGSGSGTANPSTSFTNQTSVSWSHNLNTLNVLIQCYDGANNLIAQNGHQLTSVNAATVTFSAVQTGRCVANGTGGGGGEGGGTPGGSSGQIQYNNAGAFGGLGIGTGLNILDGSLILTSAVASQLSSTAALNFGSISASACAELTMSIPGAVVNDTIQPGWPSTLEAGLVGVMSVTATDTVTVRLCKVTTGSVDPASQNFSATIVRSF